MKLHFTMFAAYNAWANRRLYDAAAQLSDEERVRDVGIVFASVLATLNHLLVTDRIWMKRFTGTGDAPTALDAILFDDFAGLREAREAEDGRIVSWVDALDETTLAGGFTYVTTLGQQISQRLAPALAHLFNHQTHHRGQVHAALTVLGQPSVPLDLVFFQRSEGGQAYA